MALDVCVLQFCGHLFVLDYEINLKIKHKIIIIKISIGKNCRMKPVKKRDLYNFELVGYCLKWVAALKLGEKANR